MIEYIIVALLIIWGHFLGIYLPKEWWIFQKKPVSPPSSPTLRGVDPQLVATAKEILALYITLQQTNAIGCEEIVYVMRELLQKNNIPLPANVEELQNLFKEVEVLPPM